MTKADFEQLETSARELYTQTERPAWYDLPATPELAQLSARPPGLALDLGAGAGRNTACLIDAGWKVVAVELDRRAVELGRQAAPTAAWHVGSVLSLSDWVAPSSVTLAVDVLGPAGDLKADWLPDYVHQVFLALEDEGQWGLQTFLNDEELRPWDTHFIRKSATDSDVGRWLVYVPRTD